MLSLVLLNEAIEALDDGAGLGTVVDEQARGAEPGLEVIEGDGDVLGEGAVEDPDLARGGGLGDAMSVVVKEDPLLPGVAPQMAAELLGLVDGGIEVLLVAGPDAQGLILGLQVLADLLHGLGGGGGGGRVDPALQLGAGIGLDDVGRVDTQVQADNEGGGDGLQALTHAP